MSECFIKQVSGQIEEANLRIIRLPVSLSFSQVMFENSREAKHRNSREEAKTRVNSIILEKTTGTKYE